MRLYSTIPVFLILSCTSQTVHDQIRSDDRPGVKVENNNWLDVNIYLVSFGGTATRLGTVRSSSRLVLRIPHEVSVGSPVFIVVDPIGSDESFQTENFVISLHKTIVVIVGQHLDYSTWYLEEVGG